MNKIIITGGAGYIANTFIHTLPETTEVVVIDNFTIDTPAKRATNDKLRKERNIRLIEANTGETEKYKHELNGASAVIYMASLNSFTDANRDPERYIEENNINLLRFLHTLEPFHDTVKHVIVTSSRGVYGEGAYVCDSCNKRFWPAIGQVSCTHCRSHSTQPVAIVETDIPIPASYYGVTKKLQEDMLRMFCEPRGLPLTILRIFNVFGEKQGDYYSHIGIIPRIHAQIVQKKEMYLVGNGTLTRDFVSVNDVVSILNTLLGEYKPHNPTEIVNVGSGIPISILDIASFFEGLGYNFEKNYRKDFGDVRYSVADNSKAKKLFGITQFADVRDFLKNTYRSL